MTCSAWPCIFSAGAMTSMPPTCTVHSSTPFSSARASHRISMFSMSTSPPNLVRRLVRQPHHVGQVARVIAERAPGRVIDLRMVGRQAHRAREVVAHDGLLVPGQVVGQVAGRCRPRVAPHRAAARRWRSRRPDRPRRPAAPGCARQRAAATPRRSSTARRHPIGCQHRLSRRWRPPSGCCSPACAAFCAPVPGCRPVSRCHRRG